MTPTTLRARLGLLCAAFGALSLAPLALSWLSAYGPAAMPLSGSIWSRLFFGQFVALVVFGYGYILVGAARTRVFHGGPMIDFTIGLGLLVVAASFAHAWIPGVFLLAFGARLGTGRPLLAP